MEHLMGESVEKRRPIPRRIVGDSVPAEYELGMYFDFFKMFVFSSSRCILLDGKTRNRIFERGGAILFNFDIENSFHESLVSEQTKNRTVREERERGSWLQLETLMFSRRGDPILYISRDIVERFYLADEIGNVRCSIACALNNIGC